MSAPPPCPTCERLAGLFLARSALHLNPQGDLLDADQTHLYPKDTSIPLCRLTTDDLDRLIVHYGADPYRACVARQRLNARSRRASR